MKLIILISIANKDKKNLRMQWKNIKSYKILNKICFLRAIKAEIEIVNKDKFKKKNNNYILVIFTKLEMK